MGVGLVSLQVAEKNRRQVRSAVASEAEGPDMRREQRAASESAPVLTEDAAHRTGCGVSSYDEKAWHRLVENDSDLWRLTSILADYGQQYVDELARDYLAAIDKNRLPAIVERIIATAKKNASPRKSKMSGQDDDPPSLTSKGEPIVADSRIDPQHDQVPIGAPVVPVRLQSNVEGHFEGAAEEPLAGPMAEEPFVDPPEPSQEGQSAGIAPADDDLAEMIRKFADSTFPRKD
jgi:hypothetical protein